MLEEYKKRSKLSYDKIQEICGVDKQNIYRTIKKETIPRLDTFAKICQALKMTNNEIGEVVKEYYEKKAQK